MDGTVHAGRPRADNERAVAMERYRLTGYLSRLQDIPHLTFSGFAKSFAIWRGRRNTSPALVQKYSDDDFDKVAASKYLPRVQLMTSNSKPCKSGEFPMNHYALVRGKNFTDLTESVNVLVIAWRPKALDMSDGVVSFFDPEHKEFQRIEEMSEQPDSGCMYGPEFLVYIPSVEEYGTFFMGSKSARNESPAIKALLGKAATLQVQHITTAKYDWYSPQVIPCTTPFDIPDIEDIKTIASEFNNPPETEVETAEETGRER